MSFLTPTGRPGGPSGPSSSAAAPVIRPCPSVRTIGSAAPHGKDRGSHAPRGEEVEVPALTSCAPSVLDQANDSQHATRNDDQTAQRDADGSSRPNDPESRIEALSEILPHRIPAAVSHCRPRMVLASRGLAVCDEVHSLTRISA